MNVMDGDVSELAHRATNPHPLCVLCDVFVLLVVLVVLVLRIYMRERSDGTNKEEEEWGREGPSF